MKIKISADSTCDLPQYIIDEYDIGISPLYVVKGGESLKDGREICQNDIFEHYRSTGSLCTTAAVSFGDYVDTFGEYLKEYDAVIHFTISSGMSACYQNALLAAGELEGIYPVDSANLSVGMGMLVVRAAQLAAEGKSVQEILDEIEAMKAKVEMSFVLDALEYLHKGGRCSAVAALGANLLKLHPSIEVHEGAMSVGKKYRGNMEKYVSAYIAEKLAEGGFDTRTAWLVDSGVPEAVKEAAAAQLKAEGGFEELIFSVAGSTICCHCGPNTLGIALLKN